MRRESEEFGAAVRAVHRERGLTQRGVDRKTGVNYNTISNMEIGKIPEMESIVRWARGLGLPVNEWLELAGYDPIDPTPDEAAEALLETAEKNPQELTYEPDLEGVRVEGFSGTTSLSPNDQEIVNRIVRHLIGQRRKHLGYHTEGADED